MPRVPDSPGVTVLPQGDYGTVQFARPQINMDFTQYGKAADYAEQGFAIQRDKIEKQERQAKDLVATDMANQYFNLGTRKLSGENGALHQMGAKVKDGHRGQAFAMGWLSELDEDGRNILSTNDDPEIRRMALTKMSAFRRAFASALVRHEADQAHAWAVATKQDEQSVALSGIEYRTTSPKDGYRQALDAQRWLDEDAGRSWRDPNVRKASTLAVQTATGKRVESAVKGFLETGDTYRAEDFLQEAAAEGIIDGNSNTRIANLISEYKSKRDVQVAGDNVASSFAIDSTASAQLYDAQEPERRRAWADYYTEADLQKPEEGYKNPVGLRSFGASAMNNAIAQYGSVEAAQYALSFESPERLETALKAMGRNFTAASWEAQMTPAEKARHTRIKKSYDTSVRAGAKTPTDAEILARVNELYPQATFEQRVKMTEQAKSQLAVKQAAINAERDATMWQINNALNSGGPVDWTKYALNTFSGEQRTAIDKLREKRSKGEDYGDDVLFGRLFDDPVTLAGMTDTDFLLLQGRLSRSQFAALSSRRQELQKGGVPQDKVETEKLEQAFNSLEVLRGDDMAWLTDTSPAAKRRKNLFTVLCREQVSRYIRQNSTKGELPDQAKYNEIVLGLMNRIQARDSSWFFKDSYLTAGELKASNIPAPLKRMVAYTQGVAEDNLSDDALVYGLIEIDTNPLKDVPREAITETERESLRALYEDATGKSNPSEAIIRQLFIAKYLGLDARMRGLTGQDMGLRPRPGSATAARMSAGAYDSSYMSVGDY